MRKFRDHLHVEAGAHLKSYLSYCAEKIPTGPLRIRVFRHKFRIVYQKYSNLTGEKIGQPELPVQCHRDCLNVTSPSASSIVVSHLKHVGASRMVDFSSRPNGPEAHHVSLT